MARNYTPKERAELVEKVARLRGRGASERRIAEQLGIHRATVKRFLEEYVTEVDVSEAANKVQLVQGHLELVQTLWGTINSAGRLMADGTMVPKFSPHQLAVLVNAIQASLGEIAKLNDVAPAQKMELQVDHSVADIARRKEGLGLGSDRLYTDEYGLTRSRLWGPTPTEKN